MADIMISCSVYGTAVPTGITTDEIVLNTLEFPLRTHCPACRKVHMWTRKDAWIDKKAPREEG